MSLRLISLSQRFSDQVALNDVSLHVRSGDCYGFIGHNGAGKTTLMRIALGLLRPNRGRVEVDGFDAHRHPREARARMGGLIEVPGFYDSWSGERNLRTLLQLSGEPGKNTRYEAGRLLSHVGLSQVGRKPVRSYSHGMKQRLGIGMALIGRPSYLLLDEPGNGLDPEGLSDMKRLIKELTTDEGMTVLLSSHQLTDVAALCNRIGVLKEGSLLIEEETKKLIGVESDRYLLQTDDDLKARSVLSEAGVQCSVAGEGLMLNMNQVSPADGMRKVVGAGLGVKLFAPKERTLEEIYLRFVEPSVAPSGGREAQSPVASDLRDTPPARLAPRQPIFRAFSHDVRRAFTLGRALLISLPALLAVFAILRRRAASATDAADVGSESLFSATSMTAFEGVAVGLQASLPFCALILAALASQSISGELTRGTWRNLMLLPIGRLQFVVGKVLSVLFFALLSYALLSGASFLASASVLDFSGVVEILPNGEEFPLVPAEELWPELRRAVFSPILPLLSLAALGFLFGSVTRGAASALGLCLGGLLALDLSRTIARSFEVEKWLPTAYLPTPLGDTSFLRVYADLAQGASNAVFDYAGTEIWVPLGWILAPIVLSVAVLWRRSVS